MASELTVLWKTSCCCQLVVLILAKTILNHKTKATCEYFGLAIANGMLSNFGMMDVFSLEFQTIQKLNQAGLAT